MQGDVDAQARWFAIKTQTVLPSDRLEGGPAHAGRTCTLNRCRRALTYVNEFLDSL
jgi:hypothetical protein